MITNIICGDGMARGVRSASPRIPFLQVPWPVALLDVITQRITFFHPHPGLPLGLPSYDLKKSVFSILLKQFLNILILEGFFDVFWSVFFYWKLR